MSRKRQELLLYFDFGRIDKITANVDCSHLLERKVMTNLESILKSREITLPKNVHLVRAMVFQVVMYGCEFSSVVQSVSDSL